MRKWLKEIRLSEKLTQEQVAALVKVNMTLIGKYELGKRRPSPETAKAIAKALNFEKYGRQWFELLEQTGA